jgi:hypothetical protein
LAASLVAPSPASAFVGESVVVNGAGTDLTAPAKSIITNPTFITTEPTEAAVVGEGSALLEAEGAAGLLPEMGLALPWVVGGSVAAIGATVACEAIFGGCLEFFGLGADPPKSAGVEWLFSKNGVHAIPPQVDVPPGYYRVTSPITWAPDKAAVGCSTSGSFGYPTEGFMVTGVSTTCTIGGVEHPIPYKVGERSGYLNRGVRKAGTTTTIPNGSYCQGAGTCGNTVRTGYSEVMAKCLVSGTGCNLTKAQRDHLGQKVASEINKKIPDPYATVVPDCSSLKLKACVALVEELDLKPKVTELDWEDAVIEELDYLEPEKTREEEAERIIEMVPPPGDKVLTESEITIESNPEEEKMPKWVPLPPPDGDDEDAEDFKKKRRLIPPLWLPTVTELDDGQLDPHKGPSAVVQPNPHAWPESGNSPNSSNSPGAEPDGRIDPSQETPIDIQVNPATAPVPAATAWAPPPIADIELDSLKGLSPCGVFPFGLFCWVGGALGQFNTSGKCPETDVPIDFGGDSSDFGLSLCGEAGETVMDYVRPAIILIFTIACGFMFARGTTAIGDD